MDREKLAEKIFESDYKYMDRQWICEVLGLEPSENQDWEDIDIPKAKDIDFYNICFLLDVPYAIECPAVETLADVYLIKEFAENYLHTDANEFFEEIRKKYKNPKYEFSPEIWEDNSIGKEDGDPDFIEPDWECKFGYVYIIE